MEDVLDQEVDAALGNGGLGRLAACYMDSLATLDYPAWGYGLRYTYDGYQVEFPDYWLNFDNPWELPRLDVVVDVQFGGSVNKYTDEEGRVRHVWEGSDIIKAVAYDVPIPGYGTKNCINIRLWSSKPKRQFDLHRFNEGQYEQAVQEQMQAENITAVLYPNDNHMVGKELRLKQQYFWVAASLHDIVRRFTKSGKPWSKFPDQVVFIPDYNVSVAEVIIPASDISQHISTAGTEASGTSNMKFVLNGGLILGTVDGANIEIHEEIGDDNIFMFGNLADQVEDLRHAHRYRNVPMDPALQEVVKDIESGQYGDSRIFAPLINTLTVGKDYYLISDDFGSYLNAQSLVDEAYKDQDDWIRKSILCTARMGKFSAYV
ncbi:9322_t:CDS:2 [Racocetra fulgida]|uniref:Alpha-1,4 glucan phosphorylase n=1 Tax=Racocetra fulgida TaxID=60492 RepID=A0A9N8VF33_9GLOM|nr:9322_t:CDS:2 [Racocetra fulgida]